MPQKFVVILAGGKGERFWPQSRRRSPKHLLPIVGDTSMLAQTLARVRPLVPAQNIFIITAADQARAVRAQCPALPRANIVAEPVGRDTAPAVALAAALVGQRDARGVFAILPADHVIHDARAYQADLRAAFAAAAAADVMVTIGIKPHEPATGFGYIQRGRRWKTIQRRPFHAVRRFVEKPSLEVARRYLAGGDYLWNAGMFVWSVPVVLAALARHAPELRAGLDKITDGLARRRSLASLLGKIYPTLPKISVDYALLEKSGNVVVLPASFDWDDVGSWPAIARHHAKDAFGNVTRGRAIVEQGRNNIAVAGDGHLVAVIGTDDLIVVHTPDATLVCPRNRAQDIKLLLKRIEAERDGGKWL
ncbi:MAG TPA: sugar phosphate nucleotidyltransferase [Opitutaceae bacterium]|jgi:mannose-1-phosphate guanylyltransferase|nr:sugar phosphate nucleotidyltransferase [Opitutaceae bacterium]